MLASPARAPAPLCALPPPQAYWDRRNPTLAFWLKPLSDSIDQIIQVGQSGLRTC
jgi:hypothetical protein